MRFSRNKVAGVVTAVALAAGGTGLLVFYVHGAEARAVKGDRLSDVLVVAQPISKGTKAEEISGRLQLKRVPDKVRANGAVETLSSLAGEVAVVDLVPGEQVIQSRFAPQAVADRQAGVPPGMLQVTVPLDAVRAGGGLLKVGDTVGVLASFEGDAGETTHLILHKVAVTGVRTDGGAPVVAPKAGGPVPTGRLLVTLAVDGPSVERVVFAAEHGRLWLTTEPKDANEGGTKVQTRGTVNG
jgi:pilus assembly protein CpaB